MGGGPARTEEFGLGSSVKVIFWEALFKRDAPSEGGQFKGPHGDLRRDLPALRHLGDHVQEDGDRPYAERDLTLAGI